MAFEAGIQRPQAVSTRRSLGPFTAVRGGGPLFEARVGAKSRAKSRKSVQLNIAINKARKNTVVLVVHPRAWHKSRAARVDPTAHTTNNAECNSAIRKMCDNSVAFPGEEEKPVRDERTNLYGLELDALRSALSDLELAPYKIRQIYASIYRRDALDPLEWTDLSKTLRATLDERFRFERPTICQRTMARDGTTKMLLDLPRGGRVEAVSIPAEDRLTFCISSQIGCSFGCSFCMTARLGLTRHLDCGEIVGQVAALVEDCGAERARFNIVFMGMGEPLSNLSAVLSAIRLLTDDDAFGLGPRRITVSTVGLPKGISRLAQEKTVPRLAVSLVAADQKVREKLMPIARNVDLRELGDAIRAFGDGRRDRPTLEVVLLDGVNDHPRLADALAAYAGRVRAKVNLIEFNPTPELAFRPSPESRMNHFLAVMQRAGVIGTVRRSRGKDASAACGQLAFTRPSNP